MALFVDMVIAAVARDQPSRKKVDHHEKFQPENYGE